MAGYIFFLIILLIVLIVVLASNKGDFLASNSLFVISLFICSTMLGLYYDKWNLSINFYTYVTYLLGTIFFVISGEISKKFIANIKVKKNTVVRKEIKYSRLLLFAFILLSFYGIALAINNLQSFSAGSITRALTIYRNKVITGTIRMPFLLSQIYKITNAAVYIYEYILIYNFYYNKNSLKNNKMIVVFIVISVMLFYLFNGGRQPIIELCLFMFFVYIFLSYKEKKVKVTKLLKFSILGICMIPVFYYSSSLVGRNFERISKFSPLEYLARYLGGGSVALNTIINRNVTTSSWGQSSFANVYGKLIDLGMISDSIENMSYHSFFEYGNTVTIFGRWYEDWKLSGVLVMSILVGSIFSILYYYTRKRETSCIMVPLYCKLVINIVWSGYDDRICQMISFSYLLIILLTIVMYILIVVMPQKIKLISKVVC